MSTKLRIMVPMSIKEQIHRLVDSLPDGKESETIEELQYRLYVLEKIRRGEEQLDRGEGVPHDEVMRRLARWLND
jgi:predicted transcriptional regulator